MGSNHITCADTDEGDLDARYAAGELAGNVTEAFEEHYFACDRCWAMVQHAIEIRAAESGAVVSGSNEIRSIQRGAARGDAPPLSLANRAPARRNIGATRWLALAAAATIVLVVGTWHADPWRRPGPAPVAMRGSTDSLHVETSIRGTTLVANWARAREATNYQVRLYTAGGTVLHQRELPDTIIAVAASSVAGVAPGTALYWEVQALNRTRQVVARSGLRATRYPRLSP